MTVQVIHGDGRALEMRGTELDHRFRDRAIARVVDQHEVDRTQQARFARQRHRGRQLAQRRVELRKIGVVRDDADRQRRGRHESRFQVVG